MGKRGLRLYLVFLLGMATSVLAGSPAQAFAPLRDDLAPPTDLLAIAVSSTEVRLTWVDHATTEIGYQVHRSLDGGWSFTLLTLAGPDVTSYSDTGLSPCTQYTYHVSQ